MTQHTGTITQDLADEQTEAVKAIMAEQRVPFEQAVSIYIERQQGAQWHPNDFVDTSGWDAA